MNNPRRHPFFGDVAGDVMVTVFRSGAYYLV